MSEFRRFVAYINLYEGNSKIHNVGFAKIERREKQCKIQVHMRETGYSGISCPMYFFVRQKEEVLGILIGELSLTNGGVDKSFILDGNNINESGYNLDQISGFLILPNEKNMFASQWDDREIKRENLIFIEETSDLLPKQPEIPKDISEKEKKEIQSEENNISSEEVLKATEAALELETDLSPAECWEEKWRFILENYPVLTPFQGEEDIRCVRIELKDLRLLPRHFWYLGNNSFLLHGFFNYRYLIIGEIQQEDTKKWFLGVPGVFQSQEKVMASIFGFSEYKGEKIAKQKTGQFGYWYRYLDL